MSWGEEPSTGPRNSEALYGKKYERVGGEYGFPRGYAQKWKDRHYYSDGRVADMRENYPVPMAPLENKYSKEFQKAEQHMNSRQMSWFDNLFFTLAYDYSNDPNYQFWQKEKQERKEALHIHDLDEWLDDFWGQVQYGLRIFTSLGIIHGVYRTHKLWSTIDRNYAKLHGVGLTSIASEQISMSVLKGAGVGLGFGMGTLVGDNMTRLGECLWTGALQRPRRQWFYVTNACITGGVFASCASVGVNWFALKPLGHAMVATCLMSVSTTVGFYLGVKVYKPWSELHPNNYEQSPRPWYEQEYQRFGTVGIRGRFM